MQLIEEGSYPKYELTDAELILGVSLSPEQKAVINNDINLIIAQRLTIAYDPDNPMIFVQKEAELKGQLIMLQFMLERSNLNLSSLTQSIGN